MKLRVAGSTPAVLSLQPNDVLGSHHQGDKHAAPEQAPPDLDHLGVRGEHVDKEADDGGEHWNDGDEHPQTVGDAGAVVY